MRGLFVTSLACGSFLAADIAIGLGVFDVDRAKELLLRSSSELVARVLRAGDATATFDEVVRAQFEEDAGIGGLDEILEAALGLLAPPERVGIMVRREQTVRIRWRDERIVAEPARSRRVVTLVRNTRRTRR